MKRKKHCKKPVVKGYDCRAVIAGTSECECKWCTFNDKFPWK